MLTYYDKIRTMSENEVLDEIDNLTRKISKTVPGTPTYNSLVELYHTAQDAYQEILMIKSFSEKKSNEVINIGTIEETVHTPDYTKAELLDAVVTMYVSDVKRKTL